MRITAKTDYALRACTHLGAAIPGSLVKAEMVSRSEGIPLEFLENILRELRRAGLVTAQRGAEGGYRLSRPAADIDVASVIAAVEPVRSPNGRRPGSDSTSEATDVATGTADDAVGDVWRALDASTRSLLRSISIADLAAGLLPEAVRLLVDPSGERGRT